MNTVFRVLKPFSYGGKTYRPGEAIPVRDAYDWIQGPLAMGWVRVEGPAGASGTEWMVIRPFVFNGVRREPGEVLQLTGRLARQLELAGYTVALAFSDSTNAIVCPACSRIFISQLAFKGHRRKVHGRGRERGVDVYERSAELSA